MKMEAPHQMRQRHPETSMRKDAATVMAATETAQSIDPTKPQERFVITSRGVFLLVMAFVTFEAFAVCVLLELSRLNPSAAAWLPINASSLREMDETLHSACMWILLAAIPITSVAAWTPTSIIAQISPATPAATTGTTTSPSISPKTAALKKKPLVPHRDPYFRIFQLVAWTLYAAFLGGWALCPNARWSFCAIDYRTTMAVLAFLAEILIVSSILALDRVHSVRSPRKERLVVMINNFNNMLLVVGAVLLGVSAELARNTHDEGTHEDAKVLGQYSLSSGVNSVALVVTAVFNTYGLAGVLAPKAGWRFYQPFTGGARFMLFQAISWTCFAAGIFIQGLYLLSVVIVELELFVGAMALAGSLFLISEVVMVMSLLVFKSKGSPEDAVRALPPFQQRLRDFTQECLGAFLVGLMANIQWIPSALFFVLYATTTSLRASQVVVYSLATSLVEVLIVISKSIATHMYNKDSQYGKLTHISEYGPKYLFPQILTMLLPAYLTHYHYVNDHTALFPVAMLTAFSYVYVFTYGGQPQVTGSRKRQSWIMERSEIMETVSAYFNGKILREAPLDPNQNYVMGFHPHGIMSTSVLWLQFSQQWRDLFPGFYANILTASVLHQIPLARDVLQFFGGREVTRQSFSRALEHKESVMLVPGGQAEMLEQRSGVKQVRVYTHHKGFIRLAMEHGTPLVPVLSFKEGETLDNVRAPQLQRWFIKKLAFPFPYYPYGRFGLPIPRKKDITIAVGAPIIVERNENPTPADVDAVHEVYFGKIKELFEKHKDEAGCADYSLVLI